MKRNKDKHLRLSDAEFDDLQSKAKAACMSDSAFIRMLISGRVPVVPDERFFSAMNIISEFADKIDEVAMKADNSVDMIAIMNEARKWRLFRNTIEKIVLIPKEVNTDGGD